MTAKDLYRAMNGASDAQLEHKPFPAKKLVAGLAAAAACLALALLWQRPGIPEKPHVLRWEEGFAAADYFAFNDMGTAPTTTSDSSWAADSIVPYADSRSFSDQRALLEQQNILPVMADYPLFSCQANFMEDGSLYSLSIQWDIRGSREDYRSLNILMGYEEVSRIEDCIAVAIDEEGNILEPQITVTQRDGVNIVAEGRIRENKTLTFRREEGWYQIGGSFNDSYEDMAALLDWVWEHPIDLQRFLEGGDSFDYVHLSEQPGAFAGVIPAFAALGYEVEQELVTRKNGLPYGFEGIYKKADSSLHWCIYTEPDAYVQQAALGELSALTQEQVVTGLEEQGSVVFLWKGIAIKLHYRQPQAGWELLASLQ